MRTLRVGELKPQTSTQLTLTLKPAMHPLVYGAFLFRIRSAWMLLPRMVSMR